MKTNRHPADELAEVRRQIYDLKADEKRFRDQVLALPEKERVGSFYKVNIQDKKRKQLNISRIEEELGDISRFYDEVPFTIARIEKLK